MSMRSLIKVCFLLVFVGVAYGQTGPGVSGAIPNGIQKKAVVMGSGGSAGGTNGQLQYNSGGALAGTNGGGDCTFLGPSTFTCTKTNGVAFGPFATSTRASNLTGPFTSLVATGPVTITGNQNNGGDQINHVSVNGMCNPDTFGASNNGSADASPAFRSCITQLGSSGGTITVGRGSYLWSSQVTFPRNVTLVGQGDNATVIFCEFNSGACAVWADGSGTSVYHRGGARDLTLNGPGVSFPVVGVLTGGDPANVIVPSADYGDMLTFTNVKIQSFQTGWEQGNNSWEVRWYSPVFTSNTTGVLIPSTGIQTGENDAIFGGAIQNGTTGIFCDNQDADFYIHSVSIDGMSGTAVKDGDGTNGGCGFQAEASHVEYFDGQLHPLAAPILYVYGPTPFTNLLWHGGAIQLDDSTAPTIESIAKVGGGANNASLSIDSPRISSNTALTFSGTCKYGNNSSVPQMCIESDGAQYVVPRYMWWDLTNSGTFQTGAGGTLNLTDPSGNTFLHFTNATGGTGWWTVNSGAFGSSQGNFVLHDDISGAYPLIVAPTTDNITPISFDRVLSAAGYGATGDAIFSTDGIHQPDGTTNGTTTFTSPTGGFTSAMVGADIFIVNAGTGGNTLYSAVVSHVTNATTLTMSSTPPTNISGTASYIIGHDNTAALQQWLNALRGTTTNGINLISRPNISGYLPAGTYLHRGLNFGGAANVTITGAGHDAEAGSQLYGGSNFLCVAPGTTPTGCHDFTGATADTIRDVAFWNGGIQSQPQTAGIWNVMFARHPTAGFAISNIIENVDFKSNGTYDVIIQNSEQNGWINDGFGANADVATALFGTTNLSNTHSFLASPFYGSTVGAGQSCTLNRFSGGATQFSADGSGHAVVLEGGPQDWTFNDAYVRLNNATDDFVSDNGNVAFVQSLSFHDLRVEPDDAGTPNPTNHFLNFTNGSSGWNGGRVDNISWAEAATQAGPIINVAGGISSVHTSNILMSNNPNPEVVMGTGSDNTFENINAPFIQYGGSALSSIGATHNFIGGAVNSFGNAVDALLFMLTNAHAGSNVWTWYNSGTGTAAPWGAGGMGWNYGGTSAGGFTSNGTFEDQNIEAGHYGCRGGAPHITGGGTISGCDAQGEIVTSTFPVTLTFNTAYNSNVSCSLTDDGQPLFWYVSSKSGSGFTLNCSTLSGGGCSGTQFVTYNCAGQGAP